MTDKVQTIIKFLDNTSTFAHGLAALDPITSPETAKAMMKEASLSILKLVEMLRYTTDIFSSKKED
jgi:hypothetical protein